MSYTALYRKWRPSTFQDVKGQDHIVQTLKNQIVSGRIGHAYLFCGTRGTGKTSVAKIFARAVNCENPADGSPCGQCPACRAILEGSSMNVVEIDAASNNGVENIRDIREQVQYPPTEGRYRVYIIDEVHMLSIGAFNALLKTLEEPPGYVIFILATTEVHKIPVTILSRCQRYDFRRIPAETIAARLKQVTEAEGISIEDKAVTYLSKAADGAFRDALSLLDQCVAFHFGETLTYDNVLDILGAVDQTIFSRMFRAVIGGQTKDCILLLEEMVMQGRELGQFVSDFTWYLRNLLLIKTSDGEGMEDVIDMSSDNLSRLSQEADMVEVDAVIRYIRELSELSGRLRYATQKRILIEIALIRLCRPQMESDTESLLDRIRALEQRIDGIMEEGIVVQAAPGAGNAAAGNTVSGNAAAAGPQKRPELPKAIPEDVKKIVENWPGLVGQTAMPMKLYLKKARLSLGGDNRLMIVLEDGLASDYFLKQEGNREELEKLLSEFAQKNIEVNFQVSRGDRDFEENHVDLAKIIHMDIEME